MAQRQGQRDDAARPRVDERAWERVTAGEWAVVSLVGEGLTNRQIGQRLHISPRTVQGHLLKVFRKLGLSSRAELAANVARLGTAPRGTRLATAGKSRQMARVDGGLVGRVHMDDAGGQPAVPVQVSSSGSEPGARHAKRATSDLKGETDA